MDYLAHNQHKMPRASSPSRDRKALVIRMYDMLNAFQFTKIEVNNGYNKHPAYRHVHSPDLIGMLENTQYIFDVETQDSLSEAAAFHRLDYFSKFAEKYQAVYVVAVPEGIEESTQQLVRCLGLPNTIVFPINNLPLRPSSPASDNSMLFMQRKPS